MNRQIRGLSIAVMVLFVALFLQVNYLQLLAADRLNSHPANTRAIVRDFSRPRGVIQTSDGVVLAKSTKVDGEFEQLREYPEGALFAHLTGYFSFTYGGEGVERSYNGDLVGREQELELKKLSDLLVKKERTGDVTLTVSKKLQQVAAEQLGERKGAVVALDPKTGAILAMADYPSYDPNRLSSHNLTEVKAAWDELNADPDKPLLSRGFRERYFPGSSFKVVTAAAALASGAAQPTQPVFPTLSELPLPNSGGQTLRNFGGSTCGGNLIQALQVSCNTAFAQLGMDMGAEKLSSGAAAFGFGKAPPVDLPFAASSNFPEASAFDRDIPGLAKSAIGQQDVAATPLQMALVAAGIANNGVIMTPHVLSEVRDAEGNVVERYEPKPWQQAVPAGVANTVRDMMVNVVDRGTGTAARIPNVQVAGKTGTAQTGLDTNHVWFISFAPANDPKIAVAVMLENLPVASEATGGGLAAPIARAVIQSALSG
ncbi:MAG: peptidoglycan D,D-transpeptidase FtsI family protein [Acidimicrobiales bacterium]